LFPPRALAGAASGRFPRKGLFVLEIERNVWFFGLSIAAARLAFCETAGRRPMALEDRSERERKSMHFVRSQAFGGLFRKYAHVCMLFAGLPTGFLGFL